MNVEEQIEYMEKKRGKNHELTIFRSWLDEKLPQYRNLFLIQVAGTNGKGSTSKWLDLMWQKKNKKVGMFTSPHLVDHCERIQVNDENISKRDWFRIYKKYEDFFEKCHLTMFEIDLWMAIAYFIEQQVDVGIIEVGLGGAKDATTSLDFKATLITNIGLDHQEYLGDTFAKVAREKAGVFKKGVPAFSVESKKECIRVFEEEAKRKDTPLYVYEVNQKQGFCYDGIQYAWSHLPEYQKSNLYLALKTMKYFDVFFMKEEIEQMIHDFSWRGRFMTLRKEPLVLVDGAHNVHGIEALISSLHGFRGHIYFSALKEKDVNTMIELLEMLHCPITLVSFDSYRLYPLETLSYPLISMDELKDIIKTTQEDILLCGSLYFVGDVLKFDCF